MALSFCDAFGGSGAAGSTLLAALVGGGLVAKITSSTPNFPTFKPVAPAKGTVDGSGLCTTGGGSFDSQAGGGGGGDGGEPGDGSTTGGGP